MSAIFEKTVMFEPVSLKRHRHRLTGGTYDPSKKEKDDFFTLLELPDTWTKMSKPIKCFLEFYCKRPKNHYKTGKSANILRPDAPIYNTNNKDLDNMVKFVLDALNNRLYDDDCLIVEILCSKKYVDNPENNNGYIHMRFEEFP